MSSQEIVQLIFSGIVTLSTVAYSILTWQLVQETKLIRLFQNTPDIQIYFDYSETDASFRYIVFTNIGLGAAVNVKFSVLKNFQFYSDSAFSVENIGIVIHGLNHFYSGQKYRYFFTDLKGQDFTNAIEDPLEMYIEYYSITGRKFSKHFELTLKETFGNSVMTPPDSYLGKISHELKEIRKIVNASNKNSNQQ